MNDSFNFADIFRRTFVEQATTALRLEDIGVTLLLTFAAGLFIFAIYRSTFQGILYTRSFNVSLVVLSMVTALVIMAISSNIILSLGMVGALSIVRFRTAIKEPMDIVFMFWAIAVGILNGAGFYLLAGVGCLVIGLILIIFSRFRTLEKPYLLIATFSPEVKEKEILDIVRQSVKRYSLKSKTVTAASTEITLELRLREGESDFVGRISGLPGVGSAVLVSYGGDYVS